MLDTVPPFPRLDKDFGVTIPFQRFQSTVGHAEGDIQMIRRVPELYRGCKSIGHVRDYHVKGIKTHRVQGGCIQYLLYPPTST